MATAYRMPEHDGPAYEDDYAAWAFHQAMLLRAGQWHRLDRGWIAEELDDLGRQQFNTLESGLTVVIHHMLKWDYQPERRGRSWQLSIDERRRRAQRQIDGNPSLRARQDDALIEAYEDGVSRAAADLDRPTTKFPATCPYSWEQVMTRPHPLPGDED